MKKKEEKASISIMKIICVSIILIFLSGIGVMAVTTQIDNVNIVLSNGYEMTVLTTKTKVSDILKDNNIVLAEDEKVIPGIEEEITDNRTITITNKSEQEVQIAKISEEGVQTSLEQILDNYAPITEKIVVEEKEIPYETITKNVAKGAKDTKNKVVKQGKKGIKEITYKVKYQNKKEIERIVLSEKVKKKPVDKIVQVQKKETTSRSSTSSRSSRAGMPSTRAKSTSGTKIYKITAYCSCSKCCGKATGRTASGTRATPGRTVAASSKFAFGTKLSINGKTYVVEDRGGAINGNKIDIFVSSHSKALAWGVKYLPVKVLN